MRENEIEKYLVHRARELGGRALKFVSPGYAGAPDRLVLLPGDRSGFLELKAPGGKHRKEQQHRIRQLQKLGCLVGVADSKEAVDKFLDTLSSPEKEGSGTGENWWEGEGGK